jgi:hypothetical protein
MTETGGTVQDNVVPFRRPPVRQSTVVGSDLGHTFAVFVREIGAWWPVRPFSFGADRVREVTFEQRIGGRVFETWDDGTVREWGELLGWDPPAGFTMTWNVTGTPTEVELRFTALAADSTRVEVEHRGWDALTEEQLVEACALPGGYLGGSFHEGWARILGSLAAAVATAASGPRLNPGPQK